MKSPSLIDILEEKEKKYNVAKAEPSAFNKFLDYIFCCRCLGCTCCQGQSKTIRLIRKFFQMMGTGDINSGLYFNGSQKYKSVGSGLLNILGIALIIILAVRTIEDILNYKSLQANMQYIQFDVAQNNQPLSDFMHKTNIQFKIKAYSFWEFEREMLDCSQFNTTLTYLLPTEGF